jgi:hypothetical protein
MGRDYKLRISNTNKFEDGYEVLKSKKLDSYDRNKSRRQNKVNLNKLSVDETDLDFGDDPTDEQLSNEAEDAKDSLR